MVCAVKQIFKLLGGKHEERFATWRFDGLKWASAPYFFLQSNQLRHSFADRPEALEKFARHRRVVWVNWFTRHRSDLAYLWGRVTAPTLSAVDGAGSR